MEEWWAEVSSEKGKAYTFQHSHTFLRPQVDMTFQRAGRWGEEGEKMPKRWIASLAGRQDFFFERLSGEQ